MNNLFVVLIPVENNKARKICEQNENRRFAGTREAQQFYPKDAKIYDISDFMDNFNNQEINENNYFLTYFTVN